MTVSYSTLQDNLYFTAILVVRLLQCNLYVTWAHIIPVGTTTEKRDMHELYMYLY